MTQSPPAKSARGRAPSTVGLLPNFLGIGAPRAGTTWLHELLATHPDACLPTLRKELDYFTQHFHRGTAWYSACFDAGPGSTPVAIGEISPTYMYRDEVLGRVSDLGTVDRFLVCVRDPVDLFQSGYRQVAASLNFRGSVDEFMRLRPDVVANGRYAEALRPWFEHFGRDAFLVLRFDRMFADVEATKRRVARFLGLDPARFPAGAGVSKVNESTTPRFRWVYGVSKRTAARLHRAGLSRAVDVAKRAGLERLVERPGRDHRELSDEHRASLRSLYEPDVLELRSMIDEDLRSWIDPP